MRAIPGMGAIPGTGVRVETRIYLLLNDVLDKGSGTKSSYP